MCRFRCSAKEPCSFCPSLPIEWTTPCRINDSVCPTTVFVQYPREESIFSLFQRAGGLQGLCDVGVGPPAGGSGGVGFLRSCCLPSRMLHFHVLLRLLRQLRQQLASPLRCLKFTPCNLMGKSVEQFRMAKYRWEMRREMRRDLAAQGVLSVASTT